MANYANLLATIAANIYTNNNAEVTAAMVKAATDSMVNSLGFGYQFRGVASPADNPGSVDQRVYYLASTPGTYLHFGGLSVGANEVAVLKWDSAWSKESLDIPSKTQVMSILATQTADIAAQDADIAAFKAAVQNQVDNYPMITIDGNVTNAPDEEDLTTDENDLLKFANRSALNGMGFVILRHNKTFAEQVTLANTIYEIRYDFDLGGASVVLPAGAVLHFAGGSIANGTLDASAARYTIDGCYHIFKGITFVSYFANSDIVPEYVGAVGDGVTDDTDAMRECVNISSTFGVVLTIPRSKYLVTAPVNYIGGAYKSISLNIKGQLPDKRGGYTLQDYGGIVVADGAAFLSSATIYGSIANVMFVGTRNLSTVFFNACAVKNFVMSCSSVNNFGAYLQDSSITSLCDIHDNMFLSVFYFSRAVNTNYVAMVDSVIRDNYINGGEEQNDNACFQFVSVNGSSIHGNFIDYYRTIIEPTCLGGSSVHGGYYNMYGNHYQVFRYLYSVGANVYDVYINSHHDYVNWTLPSSLAKLAAYTPKRYRGRDNNYYDLPPYVMYVNGGPDSIVIEDLTLERNIGNLIMFYGAPTQYTTSRNKLTIANWDTTAFGNLYSVAQGNTASCYNGGTFQYKFVETNFVSPVESLPTITVNGWSTLPYGAKVIYSTRIYTATRVYVSGTYYARWIDNIGQQG